MSEVEANQAMAPMLQQLATAGPDSEELTNDDAAWALTCAFLILTMQTGFAMLECGAVSSKNVANIMIKNVVDVSLGGAAYWIFGYALSFGKPSNWFCGYGHFFYTIADTAGHMGTAYAKYFFQFSFATTATTIVSGSVAERMKLHAYMIFSFFNTFVYCFPAGWAWNAGDKPWNETAGFGVNSGNTGGILYRLGFYDFAGTCAVHLNGGMSALVAATMLGPRAGRFEHPEQYTMSSPVTCLTGMFMLWWAWLGFNCGSTFGVSGNLWKVTALVSVTTLNGAIGGGLVVLGGLVAITGIASVTTPGEALIIGAVGGLIPVMGSNLLEYLQIDDPVGAIPVHLLAAIWGTLVVGLFGRENSVGALRGLNGAFHGGGFYLLGVQVLGAVAIGSWAAVLTYAQLYIIDRTVGIRMSEEDEIMGADWAEHGIHSELVGKEIDKTVTEFGKDLDNGKIAVEGSKGNLQAVRSLVKNVHSEIVESAPSYVTTRRHLIFSTDSPNRNRLKGVFEPEKDKRAELVLQRRVSQSQSEGRKLSIDCLNPKTSLSTISESRPESAGSETSLLKGSARLKSKLGMYASLTGNRNKVKPKSSVNDIFSVSTASADSNIARHDGIAKYDESGKTGLPSEDLCNNPHVPENEY